MKIVQTLLILVAALVGSTSGQVDPPMEASVMSMNYTHNGTDLVGYYSIPEGDGPFPAVVIIHDASGIDDYEKIRATMVAKEWGYVGFAGDIFGAEFHPLTNATIRGELLDFYRSDVELFTARIEAAVQAAASMPEVDSSNIGIMGYCFGGTGAIMYTLSGLGSAKAAVSFHGGLQYPEDGPEAQTNLLVLSGGDDDTSSEVIDLETRLNNANGTWQITRYSDIQHSFTNWFDARGRYNAWADLRSWASAGHFFKEQFGVIDFVSSKPESFDVSPVDYSDDVDGTALRGYLALPDEKWERPLPAVVIMPDWTGVDDYEKRRAELLKEAGYVAFAADIYGLDNQRELTIDERIALVTSFFSDPELFVRRMQLAVDQVKAHMDVDVDEIAMIGYCFGGSAVVYYAFSGAEDVKAVVAYHGSFTNFPVPQGPVKPYVLIESGGDDGLHGNQTIMESTFNDFETDWEITRYSGVVHGFTLWDSADAYSPVADARSWEAMFGIFGELMAVPKMGDVVDMPVEPEGPCGNDEPGSAPSDTDAIESSAITGGWSQMISAWLSYALGVALVAMLA